MTAEHRLLSRMMETYGRGDGASHKELAIITVAYSQRFGEWRKIGIETSKEPDGGSGFRYKLLTDPRTIDTINIRLKVDLDMPATPKSKAAPQSGAQMGMEI
jgi:hypothetical protein